MISNRIRQALTNNNGSAAPIILTLVLVILMCFVTLFQFLYKVAILNSVQESCRSIAENVLIANSETSYQAKRDGYTGVWHIGNGEINESIVYIDPSASLAAQLKLSPDGEDLVKTDGEKQVYRLHDIQLSIHNPEFQESNTPLTANLSLFVDINLNFPLVDSVPVSVPINVSAAWNPKF